MVVSLLLFERQVFVNLRVDEIPSFSKPLVNGINLLEKHVVVLTSKHQLVLWSEVRFEN